MQKNVGKILALAATIFIGVSPLSAQEVTTLGGGFLCSSSQIVLNGGPVDISVAKSYIAHRVRVQKNRIAALRSAHAPKRRIKVVENIVSSLRNTQSMLDACVNGDFEPAVNPLWSTLSSTYTGAYMIPNIEEASPINGPMSLRLELNGATVSGAFKLKGQLFDSVFGESTIPFSFDVTKREFPVVENINGTPLGDLTFTIQSDGAFSLVVKHVVANDVTTTLNIKVFRLDAGLNDLGDYEGKLTFLDVNDHNLWSGTFRIWRAEAD